MIDKNAFLKITYGLYIVSSGTEEKGNGFISNSVFQVTSEPPCFAVCCHKNNFTAEMIQLIKLFSVSVLAQDYTPVLMGKFGYRSGRNINKLEGLNIRKGETGVPVILNDAIAFIECKLINTFDAGTHLIFVGEVIQAEILTGEKEPLTYDYFRKIKKGPVPENSPTFIRKITK